MNQSKYQPPYIGAAYYPEVCEPSKIDKDIQMMKEMGLNLVRISEFAWSRMEPTEGHYDWAWLHESMRKLAENQIAVVLCTPTATPPAWLTQKYPETLRVAVDCLQNTHGGRKHYCPSSPVYRRFSRQISEKLAAEFSKYDNLVGWQLDNEFSGECYCSSCETAFREWLQKEYKSIEELNQKWNNDLWSQTYNDFSQIPLPNKNRGRHNPTLVYKYKAFISDSFAEFALEQAEEIRKHSSHPITTNGMPHKAQKLDYHDMFEKLDFVSNDLYDPPEIFWSLPFEFDWMRPMKSSPYWLMETSATWAGALFPVANFMYSLGALRAKMWLSFAMGGEALAFWLWQTHWAAHEMEHGGMLYAWGEPALGEKQIRQVCKEVKEHANFLRNTVPVQPSVGIHYGAQPLWIFEYGSIAHKFDYINAMHDFYRMFLDQNIRLDLVYPQAGVDKYKIVFTPYLPLISDDLLKKMEQFVSEGGTWIVGPLSGCRNEDAAAHASGALGKLEKLLGIHVRHRFPPNPKKATLDFRGKKIPCGTWCDAFEIGAKNKAIGKYADGPAKGMNAVVECSLGKGRVLVLGTLPENKFLKGWIGEICSEQAQKASAGVVLVPRATSNGKPAGAIAVEIAGKSGKFRYGKKEYKIEPYGVQVIEG